MPSQEPESCASAKFRHSPVGIDIVAVHPRRSAHAQRPRRSRHWVRGRIERRLLPAQTHVDVPILRDFERRLGSLVEGFFATTFRSGLQPVELAKRVMREMEANRTVGVREVWAPNRFELSLSRQDGERFEQAEHALVAELKRVVRETAAERGWGLVGPPEIEFEIDETLRKGRFTCTSSVVEGEEELSPQVASAATLTLFEGGRPARTLRLGPEAVTLGRLPECDVVVNDPGASRQHARIQNADGSFVLTDLGSTNGTLVNEEAVRERVLDDGDRITIGETILEFRRD